eukprot:m.26766 g.26766  ORF g.26766 m.26766 type:complete len:689 (+) comp10121_c0_seq1:129-2195(+)
MYGLLHKALMSWVSSMPNGDELTQMILAELDFAGGPDDFFRYYTDEQTGKILATIGKVTQRSQEDCKYEAGKFFLTGILESGYGNALRTLGKDFYTMLTNLDSLHESFLSSFPNMRTPSVRPEKNPDGTLSIHYYSATEGLAPFMMGSLVACAARLYDLDIEIHHRIKKDNGHGHDIFHVYMDPRGFGDEHKVANDAEEMCKITLSARSTNSLFPWHFAIDRALKVVSVGKALASRLKKRELGQSAKRIFKMLRPINSTFDFDTLADLDGIPCLFSIAAEHLRDDHTEECVPKSGVPFLNVTDVGCPFSSASSVMSSKRSSGDFLLLANRISAKVENIKLHGQLSYNEELDVVMFLGTPTLHSVEEMEAQDIELADMPVHSHAREVLYGSMFQSASAKNSNAIDERLAALDRSMAEVSETKRQIDDLLHSILPPVVASSLARGEIPPAERYSNVTVLFSDIAGFTNISSEVPAEEIMKMLHKLFMKFDALVEEHGCYKVETIGDAYMVAAGCPEELEDHAIRIGRLAIDMVHTARTILSPLDGEPIRIRIGIHSGPLMAGVVGRARPRYCLFGDTVNVASRMESNSIPGVIQVTYRFTQALPPNHPFEIVPRGHIEIKGKGMMKTFLLLGSTEDESEPLLPVISETEDIVPHLVTMASSKYEINDRLAEVTTCTTSLRSRRMHQSYHV